jgi:hypothetical protein
MNPFDSLESSPTNKLGVRVRLMGQIYYGDATAIGGNGGKSSHANRAAYGGILGRLSSIRAIPTRLIDNQTVAWVAV